MREQISRPEDLVEFSEAEYASLYSLFEIATEKMEIIERFELEVRKDASPETMAQFDTVLTDANSQYYALDALFKALPPVGTYIEAAELNTIKQNAANCAEVVGLALSLMKDRLTELGYDFNVTITDIPPEVVGGYPEDVATSVSVAESVQVQELLALYLTADMSALQVPGEPGVYKSKKTVLTDLQEIVKAHGLTPDEREEEFFVRVKNILTGIDDTTKSLGSEVLTPESVTVLSESLVEQRAMLLGEVAAFLQVEKREEALHEESVHLPEVGQRDIETEIQTNLDTFAVYQKLPEDSPLRSTAEFKAATYGFRAVTNFIVRADDPGTSRMVFNEIVCPAFTKQMNALRNKAEEYGGIDALLSDQVEDSLDKDSRQETAETLDAMLTAAVAEYAGFYSTLPEAFLRISKTLSELDSHINRLLSVRDEKNSTTKTEYVTAFISAVRKVQTEYQEWQQSTTGDKNITAAETDSFVNSAISKDDVQVPEPINPYDLSILEDIVPTSKSTSVSNPAIAKDEGVGVESTQNTEVSAGILKDRLLAEAVAPEDTYSLLRSRSLETKRAYKEKEAEFTTALTEYFAGKSFLSRLVSAKKVLGINPELPESLAVLRQEYREARALYADSLNAVLLKRSEQAYDTGEKILYNHAYEADSAAVRAAFAKRFILQPQAEQLRMQERTILGEKQQAQLKRVLDSLAKHKWLMRAGMVTAAGVAGGLSGGVGLALVGASWKATNIAASAFMGAGGAALGRAVFAADVASAGRTKNKAEASVKTNFSLNTLVQAGSADVAAAEKIDQMATEYGQAVLRQEKMVRQQKIATIGGALLAGGAAGLASGAVSFEDNVDAEVVSVPTVSAQGTPSVMEEVPSIRESVAHELPLQAMPEAVRIDTLTIPVRAFDGTLLSRVTFSDINFGEGSDVTALSLVDQGALIKYVTVKATDLLEANPTMPEARIEAELLRGIEQKFGGESWWESAKITKVDIGEVQVEQTNGVTIVSDNTPGTKVVFEGDVYTEAEPVGAEQSEVLEKVVPIESGAVYTVVRGDTLEAIVTRELEEKLAVVPPETRAVVLNRLIERLDDSPKVLQQIGLTDVDLIHPGERINVSLLENELDTVLRQEFASSKAGVLTVAADTTVQNIPITVAAPESTVVEAPSGARSVEASQVSEYTSTVRNEVPASRTVPVGSFEAPIVSPVRGAYLAAPQYSEFVNSLFGSPQKFAAAVDQAVLRFDKGTYDFTDTLFGSSYESPYTFLKTKSLAELAEFRALPSDELRYMLQQQNIKYETYLAWNDQVDELTARMPHTDATTIGDLYGRAVAEGVAALRQAALNTNR